MNVKIGWKTAAVIVGFTSAVWATEVTRNVYRAPNTEAPRGEVVTHVKAQATVDTVDAKTRMVTLKDASGMTVEVKAGQEVQRFNEIKAGDKVLVEYLKSQMLYVKKAGKDEAVRGEGEKPAGAIAGTERVSSEVMKVDYATRTLTLKGPQGHESTMHVPDSVHRFNEIKVGDHIVLERSVAVAISITKL